MYMSKVFGVGAQWQLFYYNNDCLPEYLVLPTLDVLQGLWDSLLTLISVWKPFFSRNHLSVINPTSTCVLLHVTALVCSGFIIAYSCKNLVWWLVFVVRLTGFETTWETHLWMHPWWCFQRDLTEARRLTLNMATLSRGLGSQSEEKGKLFMWAEPWCLSLSAFQLRTQCEFLLLSSASTAEEICTHHPPCILCTNGLYPQLWAQMTLYSLKLLGNWT